MESIQTLEEKIRECEAALIKLKRARNSLLDVSKLPPEILGDIFRRNITIGGKFDTLEKRSHNFLLVCHHWFEVASCTSHLWGFWGNNLKDWTKRHLRYPTAPLDLVLQDQPGDALDDINDSLRNALRDRAAQDTIRRIHIRSSMVPGLLDSIISLLVGCGEIRSSSVESLILSGWVDVSDFFSRYRFPKLQHLELSGFTISSWDLITSRTSVLTTLILYFSNMTTNAQILATLDSNPTLRIISLAGLEGPDGHHNNPSFPVLLPHLRELELDGNSRRVFGFLDRIDHPKNMDTLVIDARDSSAEEILETIGPYFRDYLKRRGTSQSALGLYLSFGADIGIRVGDLGGNDLCAYGPVQMDRFLDINIDTNRMPLSAVTLNLIAHLPKEQIICLRTYDSVIPAEVLLAQFPHLKVLHSDRDPVDDPFPSSNCDQRGEFLPCLQRIILDEVALYTNNWGPLIAFLAHRASSGNQLDIFEVCRDNSRGERFEEITAEEVESIRRTVGELRWI